MQRQPTHNTQSIQSIHMGIRRALRLEKLKEARSSNEQGETVRQKSLTLEGHEKWASESMRGEKGERDTLSKYLSRFYNLITGRGEISVIVHQAYYRVRGPLVYIVEIHHQQLVHAILYICS